MNRLKTLRENKGVFQKDVANYLGVDRTTYVKYERGDNEPNLEMLSKLADYFEVSIDYLLGRDIDIDEEIRKDKERTGYVAGHGVAGNPLPFDIGEEIRKNKKYSGYLIGFGGEGQSMKKLTEDELKTINALLDALRENHSKNKPNK